MRKQRCSAADQHFCFRYIDCAQNVWHPYIKQSHMIIKRTFLTYKQNQTFLNSTIKPLSHWDAMSSRLFCESIRETVAKCSHGIAKSSHASRTGCEQSRTVRESFKHVILFCATKNHHKTVAKSSHMSRTRRQPFADTLQSAQYDKYAT